MRPPIRISHSRGAYDVVFAGLEEVRSRLPDRRALITDENVWAAWGDRLPGEERLLVLPAGEQTKSMAYLERLVNWLLEVGASREMAVVAFGGGVIGDLAGLAAATYMRGVPLVQVPTTLLAQVDSSVGGKVGIDLPMGKNMVGAFYPPQAVYVAIETLTTLPERQLRNGLAEVWKYGFIMDPDLLDLLGADAPLASPDRMGEVVSRCVELKRQVVEEDEEDRTGRRAILNFGHTVGHAVEQVTAFGPLLHGEAISIGMVVEARVGERLGLTAAGTANRIRDCLASSGLPVSDPALRQTDRLLEAMRRDKKAQSGEIAMSLVTELGKCKLVPSIPAKVVESVLDTC